MGLVLAIANQKGGVGKTTTAVNLSAALALQGKRSLLVDLDSQGSATSGLGCRGRIADGGTVYEALLGQVSPDQTLISTPIDGLSLLPANPDLAGAEIELASLDQRETRLSGVLEPLRNSFEFIIIDCPPSLGMLTLNALSAADSVLVPLQCEFYALEGLGALLGTIERIRSAYNPPLRLQGILLTMFDARTSLSRQVADEVRRHFAGRVFATVVPRNVRIGESPSHGLPVVVYDPDSRGAQAYNFLAKELINQIFTPLVSGLGQLGGLSEEAGTG
ncbi:MAG: ParA family protein [Deltaproteobacteria bacterium]